MALVEASVRLSADMEQFKSEVKQATQALQSIRSEMALNEAQFRNGGEASEYYAKKVDLLEQEVLVSRQKQQALNDELLLARDLYSDDSNEVQSLEKHLNYVAAQEQNFQNQLSQARSELDASTTSIGELTAEIEKEQNRLDELKEAYANSVIETGRWSDESQDLATQIEQLSGSIETNKAKTDEARDAANSFDKTMQEASGSIRNSAYSIRDSVASAEIVEALDAVREKAFDMLAAFDEAGATIVEGTGASGKALSDLQQSAVDAFSSMKNADADLVDVAGVVAELNTRLGITGSEATDTANSFIKFAHHVGEDPVTSVDSLVDICKRWGIAVEEMPALMDDLTTANQACDLSVSEMSGYLIQNSTQFKELGYEVDDALALMISFADSGANTSSVMMGFKQAVANLSGETKDVPGAFQAAIDTISECDSVSEALNKEVGDTGKTVQEVFGKRAAQEIAACMQSGTFDISKFKDALQDNDGAMEETAKNATTMGDEMSRATNNLAVAFDSTLAPGLTEIVKEVADGVHGFSELDSNVQSLILTVAEVVIGFIAYKKVAGTDLGKDAAKGFKLLREELMAGTTGTKAMTAATKAQTVAANAGKIAMRGLGAAAKTVAPIAIITAIIELGTVIADSCKKADEAKKSQERLEQSTKGLQDAASGLVVALDDESDSLDEVGKSAASIDLDAVVQEHIDLANSISDLRRETATSVSSLEGYGDTIDKLVGKKATPENMAALQAAIDGLNKSAGTNYTVTKNSAEALEIQADGAKVAKDAILDLIDAEELKIKKDALLQQKGDIYAQQKKNSDDLAAAQADLTSKTEEYKRLLDDPNTFAWDLEAARESVNEAAAAVNTLTEEQGALQSAYNRTTEQETLLNMATQDGASEMLKAAEANETFKSNVQTMGADLVTFTGFLEDMGFTAADVADMSAEDTRALAQQWQQAAEACGGDVDYMRFCIQNYNSTPIVDKEGTVTSDTTQLIDAEGQIYKWNGTKLYNKNGEVKTDIKELKDAEGNIVKWNANKGKLEDLKGTATAEYEQVKNANSAIKQFRDYPKNLGEKYATLKIYQIKETKTKKTKSASGGIFPNARVAKHASGFFVDRPTTIGYTGDVAHIAGEAGLEYVGYGEGATVLPLTDPKMRPWARAVAQEMGPVPQPVATGPRSVTINMNITVQGSMDEGTVDDLAKRVRRAVRMGVR